MGFMTWLILLVSALSVTIIGCFIVLSHKSMLSDALAHTTLLGIVIGFALTKDINNPLLLVIAGLVGYLSLTIIEWLVQKEMANHHDAIALIYSLFFATAIIIISLYFRNTPIDLEAVLFGRAEFAELKPLLIFDVNIGPVALYIAGLMLVLNIAFAVIFNKELKVAIFDRSLAFLGGLLPTITINVLMVLTSFTTVMNFNVLGSIAIIAVMIGPSLSVKFFAKSQGQMIIFTLALTAIETTSAFIIADGLNFPLAPTLSTLIFLVYLAIVFFHPTRGIIGANVIRNRKKSNYDLISLLIHFHHHELEGVRICANENETIVNHLHWSKKKIRHYLKKAKNKHYIIESHASYGLSNQGHDYIKNYLSRDNEEEVYEPRDRKLS